MALRLAPEYFPGLETMARIAQEDYCVLLDCKQYSRQSFENRCRIRNPDGWQWLTIPLQKSAFGSQIDETCVDKNGSWKNQHLKGLRYNYSTAPFYEYYIDEVSEIILDDAQFLSEVTVRSTQWLCNQLGLVAPTLQSKTVISDETPVSIGEEGVVQESLDHSYSHPQYRQNFGGFEAGMSSLDLLFNHGPESIHILIAS